jgi:hypothetical protein
MLTHTCIQYYSKCLCLTTWPGWQVLSFYRFESIVRYFSMETGRCLSLCRDADGLPLLDTPFMVMHHETQMT